MLYQSEEKEAQIFDRILNILDDTSLSDDVCRIMNEFVVIPVEDIPACTRVSKEGEYSVVWVDNDNVVFKDSENAWRWVLRDLSALRAITVVEFAESEEGRKRDELAQELCGDSYTFNLVSPELQKAIKMIIEKDKK